MNRRGFRIMLTMQAFMLLLMCAWSDNEIWEKSDGSTFEASFISIVAGEAVFQYDNGQVIRFPVEKLSDDSRYRVQLADPPDLTIDLIKDSESKMFPFATRETTTRPPERHNRYGIRIKQNSSGDYDLPLKAEMFVLGQQLLGTGPEGARLILFDKKEVTFHLSREENNRTFEYMSDRIAKLRDYEWRGYPRGERYYGFLIVVTDVEGNVVGVRTSHDHLYRNVDNLRERGTKNYLNNQCERVFPTRPPNF